MKKNNNRVEKSVKEKIATRIVVVEKGNIIYKKIKTKMKMAKMVQTMWSYKIIKTLTNQNRRGQLTAKLRK
jgi:hypothetical protein